MTVYIEIPDPRDPGDWIHVDTFDDVDCLPRVGEHVCISPLGDVYAEGLIAAGLKSDEVEGRVTEVAWICFEGELQVHVRLGAA